MFDTHSYLLHIPIYEVFSCCLYSDCVILLNLNTTIKFCQILSGTNLIPGVAASTVVCFLLN